MVEQTSAIGGPVSGATSGLPFWKRRSVQRTAKAAISYTILIGVCPRCCQVKLSDYSLHLGDVQSIHRTIAVSVTNYQ